ncbi:MAG TPA: O-antigen ligase family protein [Caldimonas sp.]|nr:O-antigen ligase family protein [Caldimonas sp.]
MHPKELVVVLAIALIVFAVARPIARAYMSDADFVRRRNVWLFLTACAFLSPSFWIYAGVAAVTCWWAGRRDSNPAAFFLIAFAIIPPVDFYIPVIGINTLFSLNQARILSLLVMLPLALRLFLRNEGGIARRLTLIDVLLVAYITLQVVLVTPFESFTNTLRRSFLFGVDTLIVYYAFSRSMTHRRAIVDAMATFSLACIIYGSIAIFEWAKGWLLYQGVSEGWGMSVAGSFLMRGQDLRAQASAGHSLTLGYTLTIGFGLWLYVRSAVKSRALRFATTALFCLAIYAAHARGPWLTAVVIYFLYLAISPAGRSMFLKSATVALVTAGILAATPIGQRVIDTLPFIGTVDQENVIYRRRLAEESWRLVMQNPLFGDPFVASRMEDLRQGQGIIDLMNAYAAVALFTGLVGLALFVGFFLVGTARTYACQRRLQSVSPEVASMGATLVACMLGSLFFMATASIDWVEYVLLACMAGYISAFSISSRRMTGLAPVEPDGARAQPFAVGTSR